MLQEQGKLAASANISCALPFNANLAYALTDNLTLLGAMGYLNTGQDSSSGIASRFNNFEASVGYHVLLSPAVHSEFFAGWGKGSSEFRGHGGVIGIPSDSGAAEFTSVFLQGAIELVDDTREYGYQLKGSSIRFDRFILVRESANVTGGVDKHSVEAMKQVLLLDHTLFFRISLSALKFITYLTYASPINASTDPQWYQDLNLGVGVQYTPDLKRLFD